MNYLKRISVVLLIIALAAGVMCGCGGEQQGSDATNGSTTNTQGEATYTVTIVDQNGNAVPSVILQLCDAEGTTELAVTDANGCVSVTSAVAMDSVTLSSVPNGYTSDATVVKFDGNTELTITVQAEEVADTNVTYTVTIVDQNGNPVPGVTLQLCDDENCKLPVVTDENGTAVCTFEEANYHVSLTELPAGYSSDETSFEFDGSNEITIVINAE